MKLLLVGDPHMTPDALEEGNRLMEFVLKTAQDYNADRIAILGDLHHCHALVRVEVTHFWKQWMERLGDSPCDVVLLCGNHDLPGNASGDLSINALVSYRGCKHVAVVDFPLNLNGVLYLPYYFDPQQFVAAANSDPTNVIICHQTFCGAKYENNFPAADGVDPDLIKAPLIISGHIHMQQKLGNKVVYVGSPRWLTVSDANQERGINIFDTETKEFTFLSTKPYCRSINSYVVTPENENEFITVEDSSRARTIITLKGPKQWVSSKVDTLGTMAEKIELRSVYLEDKAPEIRESEGLASSLEKYVQSREWPVPRDELWSAVQQRVSWFRK